MLQLNARPASDCLSLRERIARRAGLSRHSFSVGGSSAEAEGEGESLTSDLCPLTSVAACHWSLVTRHLEILEPAAHFALQFQIRLAEFCGAISLFPQDDSVMQNQSHGNDEQQRDPVVQKKSERDLK